MCAHMQEEERESQHFRKVWTSDLKKLVYGFDKKEELSFLSMVGLVGLLIGLHLTLYVLSTRYMLG
jgi:hypothetical protein